MPNQDLETRCPHCRDQLEQGLLADQRLRRCRGCGFIYPAQRDDLDDPIARDHERIPGDRYRLIKPLHSWGAGRVYLARHLVLDEPCVIKFLSVVDQTHSADALRQFTTEAKAGFRIQHPNVARVLDCDHGGDHWYFVMEFVDGTNLAEIVRSCGRLPWAQVAEIGVQVARGLAAIHNAGLCHRDIKPGNLILRPNGAVKVADLGLASFLHAAGSAESAGFGHGTPHYISPEQRRAGGALDPRSDIYSLGATLFHLLVGRPPTRGHEQGPLAYLLEEDAHAPVDWPADAAPPIPKWLRGVIETCLAHDPEQRFAAADELERQLSQWLQPEERSGRSASLPGVGTPRAVVVLPFENVTADADIDWLGDALADEVHILLLAAEGVQMADGHELMGVLGRMFADEPKRLSGADILEAARRIGAAQVIRGSYQRDGNRVIVTAMHLDRERPTGRVLARIPGTRDNLLDLQTEVARQVLSALGHEIDGRRDVTTSAKPGKKLRRLYAAAQTAYTAGQYAKAVEHCGAALNEDPERIELLSLMGVCYARLGDYEHATACHKQLEQIALERNDPHRLVEANGNLGVMYYFRGEFPLAYDLMRRSGQLASDLNLLPLLAKTCSNLGFVLNKMERLAEADQAFGEAIQIKLSLGATASLVAPYNGRGEIALQQGRWNDALDCYRQALDWAVKLSDRVSIGLCHTNLGRCYVQMQDYALAEQHLQEAVTNLAATDFPNGMALAYEQLAELHLRCGRLEDALESADRRIGLARRHANRHMEAAAWEQKARVYEKSGRKDEVIDCMRKSFELQQTKSPYEPLPSSPAFHPRRQPNP